MPGVQLGLEVFGREHAAGDQVAPQSRDIPRLQVVQDPIAVLRPLHRPIDFGRPQMRYRREGVVGRAPFRREAWITGARRVKIEGEVVGQIVLSVDL